MGYSILKYGRPMLTGIEGLEEAKKEALRFVTPVTGSEFIEIRDSEKQRFRIRDSRFVDLSEWQFPST